jgi:hypothetical protein
MSKTRDYGLRIDSKWGYRDGRVVGRPIIEGYASNNLKGKQSTKHNFSIVCPRSSDEL